MAAALASIWTSAPAYAILDVVAPMPSEVSSNHFIVAVNGTVSPVMHAAAGYYLLNFDAIGTTALAITASDPHYWDAGVEVQPMRLGIRPKRTGATITFSIDGPVKLSITRPNDHFGDSEMLFLFGNQPDHSGISAETPGIRYYGAGIHRENIDAHSGDRIYLAAGAVVFGSLNIWQVHDVHVSGTGTIIYDGPQDPAHDEGWMHKRDWHVIVMDNASNIDIEGITGIVRSRTWMVQMRDSHQITFLNVKIIGGTPGNANQDGMDWLGGGDTLIQDSFFRAADDVFAMYGNWDGYTAEALATPGHEVSNIVIESSVLSTSISNIVRVGWPKKIFDSHKFTLRDTDVIHMGFGSCGVPFALFEIWADPAGRGKHDGYTFEDIRLEDWYSLTQLRQPEPGIRDVTFDRVWAMDGPGLSPSALKGDVSQVSFQDVNLGTGDVQQNADVPLDLIDGAESPQYEKPTLPVKFTYSSGLLRPGVPVTFTAEERQGFRYHWLFGDGTSADGPVVRHVFPDADGTLLDGSGRFRVLLSVVDQSGYRGWGSHPVILARSPHPAVVVDARLPLLPGLTRQRPSERTEDGFIRIATDGGYTFTLLTSTRASLAIDDVQVNTAKLRPQVCGSPGNAVQAVRVSVVLTRGLHRIRIVRGPEIENAVSPNGTSEKPMLLWEGPGAERKPVPEVVYFHSGEDQQKPVNP